MVEADYYVKRNDQGLTLEVKIEEKNPTTGVWAAKDLTEFSAVKLLMKSDTAAVWGNGTFVGAKTGGIVRYVFDSDDLDFGGLYNAEIELRNADASKIETVPNGAPTDLAGDDEPEYFTVYVPEDLG